MTFSQQAQCRPLSLFAFHKASQHRRKTGSYSPKIGAAGRPGVSQCAGRQDGRGWPRNELKGCSRERKSETRYSLIKTTPAEDWSSTGVSSFGLLIEEAKALTEADAYVAVTVTVIVGPFANVAETVSLPAALAVIVTGLVVEPLLKVPLFTWNVRVSGVAVVPTNVSSVTPPPPTVIG